MLSICIPIYNFDVSNLLLSLSKEIENIKEEIEVILIDDCSSSKFIAINKEICSSFNYIELSNNIGRARIRNLFLEYAKFDYLLFLDCDSLIKRSNFLATYISQIKSNQALVICGGRVYDEIKPSKEQLLSWKYGIQKESQPDEVRKLSPYDSFMTNNFVVAKSILVQIPFDESLAKYGHEDTLFGFYLNQNSVSIAHVDNPILNGDIEKNNVFLEKTKHAIDNLALITEKIEDKEMFIQSVKLLSYYFHLKRKYALGIVLFFAPLIDSFFKLFLKLGLVNLTLFNYYKLSYLAKVMKQKKS